MNQLKKCNKDVEKSKKGDFDMTEKLLSKEEIQTIHQEIMRYSQKMSLSDTLLVERIFEMIYRRF